MALSVLKDMCHDIAMTTKLEVITIVDTAEYDDEYGTNHARGTLYTVTDKEGYLYVVVPHDHPRYAAAVELYGDATLEDIEAKLC